MKYNRKFLIFILSIIYINVFGQYKTEILNPNVKSLKVSRSGWPTSYPVISTQELQGGITINFDILESDVHQISYTITHCNAEWKPSDLSSNEYLNGFQDNYINDYDFSRSTNVDYVNYNLNLPNDDVQMRLSGNYSVVFFDEDIEDTIAVACFSVFEPLTSIYGTVSGISGRGNSAKSQQLNFTIEHPNIKISQPLIESKVSVIKNGSRLHQVIENTPTYIHADRLIYEQHPKMTFSGGDEYRLFETSSLRYNGKGIQEVAYYSPYYHITLEPDEAKGMRQYEYDDDINGKFLIRRQESRIEDSNTEADYTIVHFSIPMEEPILYGKAYVGGEFVYDVIDERTQLTYNAEKKAYEHHLLLKQGYYNYRYYLNSNFEKKLQSAPFEKDAYQTENDYQVFFYYREISERYDRLIGYEVINTIK